MSGTSSRLESTTPSRKKFLRIYFQLIHTAFAADEYCAATYLDFQRLSICTEEISGDRAGSLGQGCDLISRREKCDSFRLFRDDQT